MSESLPLKALFGGTFDPIHNGHLNVVNALAQEVNLKRVVVMPNNVPPHRPQPEASPAQRAEMVRRAIADNPLFELDLREMARESPSYTVDTLAQLRAESGAAQPLAFIIGQDSLLSLHKWHRWEELLSLCHLLVCKRPGYENQMETPALQQWLDAHRTRDIRQLHDAPAGSVWLADTPLFPVSATGIRERLHQGDVVNDLLPAAVLTYINEEGLYRKPDQHGILRR